MMGLGPMRQALSIAAMGLLAWSGCYRWGPLEPTGSRVVDQRDGAVSVRAQTYQIDARIDAGAVVVGIRARGLCVADQRRDLMVTGRQRRALSRTGTWIVRGSAAALALGLGALAISAAFDDDGDESLNKPQIAASAIAGAGLAGAAGVLVPFVFGKRSRVARRRGRDRREVARECPPSLVQLPARAVLVSPWGERYTAPIAAGMARFTGIDWSRASAGRPWSVILDQTTIRWTPRDQALDRAHGIKTPSEDTRPPSPPSPSEHRGSGRSPDDR
jgi:hypothetical protein